MKIFFTILTLLGIFTINAFAQMGSGGSGVNPGAVAPPAPGAPPPVTRPMPTPQSSKQVLPGSQVPSTITTPGDTTGTRTTVTIPPQPPTSRGNAPLPNTQPTTTVTIPPFPPSTMGTPRPTN